MRSKSLPAVFRGRLLAVAILCSGALLWPASGRAAFEVKVDAPNDAIILGTNRTFRVVDENGNAPTQINTTQWQLRATANDQWTNIAPVGNSPAINFNIGRWGDFQLNCHITFTNPGMGQPQKQPIDVPGSFTSVGPDDMVIIAGTEDPMVVGSRITVIYQLKYGDYTVGGQFNGWCQERVKQMLGSGQQPPYTFGDWFPADENAYNNMPNPRYFYRSMNVIFDAQLYTTSPQTFAAIGMNAVFETYDIEVKLIAADWSGNAKPYSKVFEFQRRKVSNTEWQIEER